MPFPLAPAILGAASLGSSLISNSGSRRSQNRANKHNIAFWNMQNEYNNPQAQMERLRKAGLNPNMIYGASPTSATGNAGQIAPSKPAPYNIDNPLKDINQFADVKQREATTDNLKAQNTVLQQEAILKAAQTGNIGINTAKSKFDLGLAEELKNTSLQAATANLRQTEQNTIGKQLDNTIKSQTVKEQVKRIFYESKIARETLKGTDLQNQLKQLEIDLRKLGIERNDPWYFRILGRNWEQISPILKK